MKAGFIGAGKVGCSLGRYFTGHQIPIAGYVSRSSQSAHEAAHLCHTKCLNQIDQLIAISDVLFLTVPDNQIVSVWNQVRQYPISGKYICHCSGSFSSAVFSGIEETGAYGFSVHPMYPFHSKTNSYQGLKDALFTVEGSSHEQAECLGALLEQCGNRVVMIPQDGKTRYHAAAVFASNLVTALLDCSICMLESCGFSKEDAQDAVKPLVMNNIEHIFKDGCVSALTGPVERNDVETVKKHFSVLSRQERDIYVPLTMKLVNIAKQKNPSRSYEPMMRLLLEEQNEANNQYPCKNETEWK